VILDGHNIILINNKAAYLAYEMSLPIAQNGLKALSSSAYDISFVYLLIIILLNIYVLDS